MEGKVSTQGGDPQVALITDTGKYPDDQVGDFVLLVSSFGRPSDSMVDLLKEHRRNVAIGFKSMLVPKNNPRDL